MTTPSPSPVPTATERLLLRLEWRVLRRLEGRVAGGYRTGQRGPGTDLAGLRAYGEGDDARHIDWNVTARLNEPQLRVFNEDRELNPLVVVVTPRPPPRRHTPPARAPRTRNCAEPARRKPGLTGARPISLPCSTRSPSWPCGGR